MNAKRMTTLKKQLIKMIIERDEYTKLDSANSIYIGHIENEVSRFFDDMNGEHRYATEDLVIAELNKL
jgi:hypothetical protein